MRSSCAIESDRGKPKAVRAVNRILAKHVATCAAAFGLVNAVVMPWALAPALIVLAAPHANAFDRELLLKEMHERAVVDAEKQMRTIEASKNEKALPGSLQSLAVAYENANRLQDAELILRRLASILESRQPVDIPALSSAEFRLAELLEKQGQVEKAEELFLTQLRRASKVEDERCRKGLSAAALSMLAGNDFRAGRIEKAEARLSEGMAMAETRFISDITLLASIRAAQGKTAEAEQLFKEAMQRAPNTIATMTAYAEFLEKQHRTEEANAQKVAARALKEFQENLALTAFVTVKAMDSRKNDIDASQWGKHIAAAKKAQAEGNFDALLSECRSALQELKKANQTKVFKDESWNWISNTAASYQEKGDFKKAAELYAVMVPFASEVEEADYMWSPFASLASASLNARNFGGAERAYRQALQLSTNKDDPTSCTMLIDLALVLEQMKKFGEAEAIYKELMAGRLSEQRLGERSSDNHVEKALAVQALLSYSLLLRHQNRNAEAALNISRAEKMAQRPELADQYNRLKSLASSCQQRGQAMEAARALECAALIKPAASAAPVSVPGGRTKKPRV